MVEAALRLAFARLELLMFSFERLAARLGDIVSPTAVVDGQPNQSSSRDSAVARDISWAVTCAARHVPFEAVCLPQAIAAKKMLARRSVKCLLHFGVAKDVDDGQRLAAHAWVDAAGVEVTGYPVPSQFREVAYFS